MKIVNIESINTDLSRIHLAGDCSSWYIETGGLCVGCGEGLKNRLPKIKLQQRQGHQYHALYGSCKNPRSYLCPVSTITFLGYPITGRTHQIRVHLKHIGHPIVNDYVYNPQAAEPEPLNLDYQYASFGAICFVSEIDVTFIFVFLICFLRCHHFAVNKNWIFNIISFRWAQENWPLPPQIDLRGEGPKMFFLPKASL